MEGLFVKEGGVVCQGGRGCLSRREGLFVRDGGAVCEGWRGCL